MVFPSVPVYLDPPNWNQAQVQQVGANAGGGDAQQLPPPGMAPPRPEGSASGTIRPNSMAERARLAKIPQPETALKCPRCESANTKFCYFNNYSLSQPRHFCKTCRRYWTRGGALRNVPVGGGCRRNKRSKSSGGGGSSSSKSSTATTADRHCGASSSSSSTATSAMTGAIPSNLVPQPHLPFMASLHPLAGYSTGNIGLNFGGMQAIDNVEYQVGSSSGVGLEQWRIQPIQQLPFLGAMETPPQLAGLFPFDHGEGGGAEGMAYSGGQVQAKASSAGLITQLASVKMEDSAQNLSLARQYLGMPRNDQFWAGSSGGGGGGGGGRGTSGGWTDLSGFSSSSAGNLL